MRLRKPNLHQKKTDCLYSILNAAAAHKVDGNCEKFTELNIRGFCA